MSSSTFPLRLATEQAVVLTVEQIAREGARRFLQKAIEDEVADYINVNAQSSGRSRPAPGGSQRPQAATLDSVGCRTDRSEAAACERPPRR